MPQFSVRLTDQQHKQLSRDAQKSGLSMNQLVIRSLFGEGRLEARLARIEKRLQHLERAAG